jgi:hypothetical protein
MTPLQLLILVGMIVFAVYKQTQVRAVPSGFRRFKLALIYGAIGYWVGGFGAPSGAFAVSLLAFSILLSVVVGLARGVHTRIWLAADGTPMSQGTVLTVGLFLGMVTIKFALGFYTTLHGIQTGDGFGEILVMVALMLAAQSQIMSTRAEALARSTTRVTVGV